MTKYDKRIKIERIIVFSVLAVVEIAVALYVFHTMHAVKATWLHFAAIGMLILATVLDIQNILGITRDLKEHSPKAQSKPSFVYLCHPYGGDPENLKNCIKLYTDLQPKMYNEHHQVLVSPLQLCNSIYDVMDYEDGLSLCMAFLTLCDEMWVCPGWENSIGCKREIEYATTHKITIKYIQDSSLISAVIDQCQQMQ